MHMYRQHNSYHTVHTEEKCCHSKPKCNAFRLTRDILHVIHIYSTEHVVLDKAKYEYHLERRGRGGGGGGRGRGGGGGRGDMIYFFPDKQ